MKPIYIHNSIIIAFLLKNDPHHKKAVFLIASLLRKKNVCVSSLEDILQASQKLKALTKQPEEIIIEKIHDFIDHLHFTFITSTNEQILTQTKALVHEYKISFPTAFLAAIMMEHKVNTLATVDSDFDMLFNEGFLLRYDPDEPSF